MNGGRVGHLCWYPFSCTMLVGRLPFWKWSFGGMKKGRGGSREEGGREGGGGGVGACYVVCKLLWLGLDFVPHYTRCGLCGQCINVWSQVMFV